MPPKDQNNSNDATSSGDDLNGGGQQQHHQQQQQVLECDYLVVGAGTSGMAFIDTILTEKPNATIILVDRNTGGPGGHWQHVYPFCKLHQPSCNYGVNSLKMGKTIDSKGNERYDINDRATGAEVVDYYKKACEKFQQTGRFKSFFGVEYDSFDEEQKFHVIRPTKDNNNNNVTASFSVRCGKLVTVANNVEVPSMRKPIIPVHKDAHFVPVNAVPTSVQSGNFKKYVVFGCGKTGADAIVYLLRNGINQSQITWIVSRDVWYFLRDSLEDFWASNDLFMKPMLQQKSVKDVFLAWEKNGLIGRLENDSAEAKNGSIPQVFKGPTMDLKEFQLMRSVQNIVRMGRATSVEKDKIILDKGSIEYNPDDTLLVDCMVDGLYGYDLPKDFTIFEPGRINMGPITFVFNASASAAHIAFLECALGDDDDSKNDCCYFIRGVSVKELSNIENMIGAFYLQNKGTDKLMKVPGGSKFFMKSRVNLLAPFHHKGGMCRFMWFLFGPQRAASQSKKLTKKVESKGFNDLHHCFGIETLGSKKKKKEL